MDHLDHLGVTNLKSMFNLTILDKYILVTLVRVSKIYISSIKFSDKPVLTVMYF